MCLEMVGQMGSGWKKSSARDQGTQSFHGDCVDACDRVGHGRYSLMPPERCNSESAYHQSV